MLRINNRRGLLKAANAAFGTEHPMSRYIGVKVVDQLIPGYAGCLLFKHVNGVGRKLVRIGMPGTLQEQFDEADWARPFISITKRRLS